MRSAFDDVTMQSDIAFTLRESVERLAERAREEAWTHEEFLAACLQREVAARDAVSVSRTARRQPLAVTAALRERRLRQLQRVPHKVRQLLNL